MIHTAAVSEVVEYIGGIRVELLPLKGNTRSVIHVNIATYIAIQLSYYLHLNESLSSTMATSTYSLLWPDPSRADAYRSEIIIMQALVISACAERFPLVGAFV